MMPMKEPKAALKAGKRSRCLMYSPTKAPTKGQKKTPIRPVGPKGSPMTATNSPMVHPHTPYFVPPN